MNFNLLILKESIDPVDALDKVVEHKAYAEEYGFVAMPLEVTSGTGKLRFCGEIFDFPV